MTYDITYVSAGLAGPDWPSSNPSQAKAYHVQLDDYCGWPEGCHASQEWLHPSHALPEELELGIPAGTFKAIQRLWSSDRLPLPARYGGQGA